jgi:hypothetical protein
VVLFAVCPPGDLPFSYQDDAEGSQGVAYARLAHTGCRLWLRKNSCQAQSEPARGNFRSMRGATRARRRDRPRDRRPISRGDRVSAIRGSPCTTATRTDRVHRSRRARISGDATRRARRDVRASFRRGAQPRARRRAPTNRIVSSGASRSSRNLHDRHHEEHEGHEGRHTRSPQLPNPRCAVMAARGGLV